MRLIDADELLEKYESYGNTSPIALTFIDDLNEMPTVEQKHGHWNRENSDYDCSNCGNSLSNIMDADSYYAIGFDGVPYCPYCGAKMDEEVTK